MSESNERLTNEILMKSGKFRNLFELVNHVMEVAREELKDIQASHATSDLMKSPLESSIKRVIDECSIENKE